MLVKLERYVVGGHEELSDEEYKEWEKSSFGNIDLVTKPIELNPKFIVAMYPEFLRYNTDSSGMNKAELEYIRVEMVSGRSYRIKAKSLEELHLKCCIDNGEDING